MPSHAFAASLSSPYLSLSFPPFTSAGAPPPPSYPHFNYRPVSNPPQVVTQSRYGSAGWKLNRSSYLSFPGCMQGHGATPRTSFIQRRCGFFTTLLAAGGSELKVFWPYTLATHNVDLYIIILLSQESRNNTLPSNQKKPPPPFPPTIHHLSPHKHPESPHPSSSAQFQIRKKIPRSPSLNLLATL